MRQQWGRSAPFVSTCYYWTHRLTLCHVLTCFRFALCVGPRCAPGPEKFCEEATRWFMVLGHRVERGRMPWGALPTDMRREVDAAVGGWRAAADEGLDVALSKLASIFMEGKGVLQNKEAAVRWLEKAAAQGNLEAPVHLGILYEEGKDVSRNASKAAQFFEMAAHQGHAAAQCTLGGVYEQGRGNSQSYCGSIRLLTKEK